MSRDLRSKLSYANVMATLAFFIAVGGGTAFAVVSANQVNSASIINGQVKKHDLGANVLKSVNAGSVSGVQVRKIRFVALAGTPPTTVLNLGGLVMTAECQEYGDYLDVKARTTKNGASVYLATTSTDSPDDRDTNIYRDLGGADYPGGSFNTNNVLEVDNGFSSFQGIGTLNYEAPDGTVVVVHLARDFFAGINITTRCGLTGIAIGG